MVIKTKDFILRPVRMSDAKEYWEAMQDKDTIKGFNSVPKNFKEAKNEVKDKIKRTASKNSFEYNFAIDVNGRFAGCVWLHEMNRKPLNSKGAVGTVGYFLHPQFRGNGLATKSVKLIINYAFKKYKIKRVSGRCRSFNKASAKVMEKAGFKFEGCHKKEVFKNGRYYDVLYYAITK
jgi:[ribosomal protein S5]-alanine N-acetyltransferase